MAYCELDDIRKMLKSMSFGSATKVTDSELSEKIDEFSGVMDGRLARMYVVPITETGALKVLKLVCQYFVAADIVDIVIGSINGKKNGQADEWRKFANSVWEGIFDGTFKFSADVTSAASDLSMTGEKDGDGVTREPKFTLDKEY